jgi:hypothetical protein
MDKVEAIVQATGARVVIQHESADIAALPQFPAFLGAPPGARPSTT